MDPTELPKEQVLSMYRTMATIRSFEEKVAEFFVAGQVPGFVHSSLGQEASAAGVCAALRPADYISSTHRGHGHLLAKGGEIKPMMAEIFGKRAGYCKGKGGSMHIVSYDLGILGANGIVGAGIPIATGAALAAHLRKEDRVAVAFFGDGASNEGTFHESLNLAALWKLPAVYVCENNHFAEFTATSESTSVEDIAVRAQSYGIPGVIADGNSVLAVYEATVAAVERARAGEGPTLIETKTYRWEGHVVGEQAFMPEYRVAEEVEQAKQRCPIVLFGQMLTAGKVATQAELDAIRDEVARDMNEAVRFAQDAADPQPEEALDDVFAP